MKKSRFIVVCLLALLLSVHMGSRPTLAQDGGTGGQGGTGDNGGTSGSGGTGGQGGSAGGLLGNGGTGGQGGSAGGLLGGGGTGGQGGSAGGLLGNGGRGGQGGRESSRDDALLNNIRQWASYAQTEDESLDIEFNINAPPQCPRAGTSLTVRLVLSATETAAITDGSPPDENLLVAASADNFVNLYRLSSDEWQINIGPTDEGRTLVCIWTSATDVQTSSF